MYDIYFPDSGKEVQWDLSKCLEVLGRDSMEEGLRGYGVDVITPVDADHPHCAGCHEWVLPDVLDADGRARCCAW